MGPLPDVRCFRASLAVEVTLLRRPSEAPSSVVGGEGMAENGELDTTASLSLLDEALRVAKWQRRERRTA